MKTRLVRAAPYVALLAGCALLYWAALQIDTRGAQGGRRIGPDFWPKAILAFLALLCAYETARRLLRRDDDSATDGSGAPAHEPTDAQAPASDASPGAVTAHPRRLLAGIALIAAYAFTVDKLGFFVSTAAFLTAFMLVGGWRRPLLAASIGLAGSLLLIVVFMRVAYISLPLGAGPFRELSLALLRVLGVT